MKGRALLSSASCLFCGSATAACPPGIPRQDAPPPQNRHSEVSRHAREETAARSFTVVTEPPSRAFGSRRGQTATVRTPAKTQVYYLISVFFCSGLNLQYERAKISQWLAFGTEAGKTNQLGGKTISGVAVAGCSHRTKSSKNRYKVQNKVKSDRKE